MKLGFGGSKADMGIDDNSNRDTRNGLLLRCYGTEDFISAWAYDLALVALIQAGDSEMLDNRQ